MAIGQIRMDPLGIRNPFTDQNQAQHNALRSGELLKGQNTSSADQRGLVHKGSTYTVSVSFLFCSFLGSAPCKNGWADFDDLSPSGILCWPLAGPVPFRLLGLLTHIQGRNVGVVTLYDWPPIGPWLGIRWRWWQLAKCWPDYDKFYLPVYRLHLSICLHIPVWTLMRHFLSRFVTNSGSQGERHTSNETIIHMKDHNVLRSEIQAANTTSVSST